ncbi:MAG: hypothetical protein HKN51_14180, partial [Saprospiraceae bacterium]|nr:hypothetical protein [Saprospiraceae bacterium]
MKTNILLFIAIYFFSCMDQQKSENNSQKKESATIIIPNESKVEFKIDCSIRALAIENDSTCWFAGSK